MKNIITIFLFALLLAGCSEDFTERTPTTSSVIQTFYKTPENGEQSLTSVYNMLLRDDWWSQYIFSEIASDNAAGGAGTGDGGGFQRVDRGLKWLEANAHQVAWTTYYGGICRANIYLKYESGINWTGKEALQKQYIAEAKFLRAYFHFYLAKMFGEIPSLSTVITPDQIPGRTPAEELYAFILDDLKYCIENGLSDKYGSMKPENQGRATKWAAEAMFARVFMYYSGYYNKSTAKEYSANDALTYLEDLIANGGFSLVPSFAGLWVVPSASEGVAYVGEVNPEAIWSIRFNPTGSAAIYGGGQFMRMIGPRGTNSDPYGNGWGAMPILPSLWEAYDTADTRRTATILSWEREKKVYGYVAQQQAQYTGYNIKKYCIKSVNNSVELAIRDWQADAYEDYMVIRYADVLLMAAELNLSSNSAKSLDYLNQVRARAFGNTSKNYSTASLENIMNERRLEFVGENIRYWDILRSCKGDFSKLKDMLTYVDNSDGGDYSGTIDITSLDVDGTYFVNSKGLFQIPQNEIDLMKGAIEDNPR